EAARACRTSPRLRGVAACTVASKVVVNSRSLTTVATPYGDWSSGCVQATAPVTRWMAVSAPAASSGETTGGGSCVCQVAPTLLAAAYAWVASAAIGAITPAGTPG